MANPKSVDSGRTAQNFAAVTPSDTVDFADGVCSALRVGTGGTTLTARNKDGTLVVFANVANGETLPVQTDRIMATGTNCTNIVAYY